MDVLTPQAGSSIETRTPPSSPNVSHRWSMIFTRKLSTWIDIVLTVTLKAIDIFDKSFILLSYHSIYLKYIENEFILPINNEHTSTSLSRATRVAQLLDEVGRNCHTSLIVAGSAVG
jgi:hypothetical protein